MSNCIILSGGTWVNDYQSKIQRSLGPYRLSNALEKEGYSTFVLDFIIHLTTEEIIKALSKQLTPDTLWVGFSSTFFWASNVYGADETELDKMYWIDPKEVQKIIDYIRLNSNAKIVYGGAKTPFVIGVDKNIDYYVVGYADLPVVELTKHIDGKCILSHVEEITSNQFVIDSAKYGDPAMDTLTTHWNKQHILNGEGLPIELARGCIFKCKFCSYPLLGKKKGTYLRDTIQVKDELIRTWEEHGTTSYAITDDTFNDDNDKIEALHKVFTSLPFKPKFSCYLRIDLLNKYPHQADMLTEMGLVGTYFGLETTQPQSAIAIGKGLHPNKVKDRLYWLSDRWKNKVNIAAGFILGLPYDTKTYFDELFDWCMEKDNPIQFIQYYALMFYNTNFSEGSKSERLKAYFSEFTLHPEIYGYEFKGDNNIMNWNLPQQNLNYSDCDLLADYCNKMLHTRNKVSAFEMTSYLNLGVDIDDLYNLTISQVDDKYNINALNDKKILEYKQLVGICK